MVFKSKPVATNVMKVTAQKMRLRFAVRSAASTLPRTVTSASPDALPKVPASVARKPLLKVLERKKTVGMEWVWNVFILKGG